MGCRGLERAPGGETDMRGTDDFRLTGGRVYISSRRTGWLLDFLFRGHLCISAP